MVYNSDSWLVLIAARTALIVNGASSSSAAAAVTRNQNEHQTGRPPLIIECKYAIKDAGITIYSPPFLFWFTSGGHQTTGGGGSATAKRTTKLLADHCCVPERMPRDVE